MAVRAAPFSYQIKETTDPARCKERDRYKGDAEQDSPPVDPLDCIHTEVDIRSLPASEPC